MDFRAEIVHAAWRATAAAPKPDVSFVPPLERRRLTGVERAALAVAWPVRPAGEAPVVFASRWGEIGVTAKLMRQFHAEGEMSPAGFSASVHNAAPGVFSLLTKNRAPYTAIAARARSLEAGLLETFALGREAVFVYAEEATPELYAASFPDLQAGCAVALRVTPGATGGVAVRFRRAETPPARPEALLDFLEGRAATFEAADFALARAEPPR